MRHHGIAIMPVTGAYWDHRENPMTPPKSCAHLRAIDTVRRPDRPVCGACLEIGSTWVHLRTCQQCGVTSCCDSSPNRHARAHHEATGHPVIASAEPGERWLYCYPDDAATEY
jgi:hypothetical protein